MDTPGHMGTVVHFHSHKRLTHRSCLLHELNKRRAVGYIPGFPHILGAHEHPD